MSKLYRLYIFYQSMKQTLHQQKWYQRYRVYKEELEDQKLNRICVGEDRMGNKFYQYYSYFGLPTRREIKFVDDTNKVVNDLAYYDWLYKRDDAPPTVEQLEQFYVNQSKRYELARKWDNEQELLMNSFREQRLLKEDNYKRLFQQRKQSEQSEIFQEIADKTNEQTEEAWTPKSRRNN